jgi:hypothetical protein
MTENSTITVWVTEHDDPSVVYVVNTREDMEGNFGDFLNEQNGEVTIRTVDTWEALTFDAADVLRNVDPIAYDEEFRRYAQGWTQLEMPLDLYLGDDENARIEWITANVGN